MWLNLAKTSPLQQAACHHAHRLMRKVRRVFRAGPEEVGEVHCAGEFSGSVVFKSTPNDLLLVRLQSCSGVKMPFGALRRSSTWVSTKTALARRFWPLGPLMPRSFSALFSLPPLCR